MRYPEEEHTLICGLLVHSGAVSMLEHLLATGHQVRLDEDGAVRVTPLEDLHPDAQWLLSALEEDLALLLRMDGGTVH